MTSLKRLLGARESGLALAILLVIGVISLVDRQGLFFGQANQTNLWRQVGLLGVFAVGEAVVIIAGGLDLSVGSVIAVSGMCAALAMRRVGVGGGETAGLLAGLAAAALVGLLVGVFHSLLVTRLKLPPFIATLGTLAGLRSVAELITQSKPVTCSLPVFLSLAKGLNPLYIFIAVALLVAVTMRSTTVGRQLLALGGNAEAARLSGLNCERLQTIAYCLSALLAAFAGLLYAAYTGQGDPRAGVAYELQAIAAVVVGGCALTGGSGTIPGVILGVILLQVTLSGILICVSRNATQWQGLVVGAVVIFAVALNSASQRRLGRSA